jgi:hypothetical protein
MSELKTYRCFSEQPHSPPKEKYIKPKTNEPDIYRHYYVPSDSNQKIEKERSHKRIFY